LGGRDSELLHYLKNSYFWKYIPKNQSYDEATGESSEYTIEIVKKDPEWGILELDFSKPDKEPKDFPGNVIFYSGTGMSSGRYK